ncbi:MAG: hypothetical protein KA371_14995 [Acidobacteria bacterium]|nr:hypothetical protein [Acidobacteriota bacterium]
MLTLSRRLLAAALTVLVGAGNVAACEGWAPTPEARMSCCTDGQPCHMHAGASHGATATHDVNQTDADSCCASSEQEQSGQDVQAVVVPVAGAVLGLGVVVPPLAPRLVLTDAWRSGVPIPPSPVPKHVLLSVFLL